MKLLIGLLLCLPLFSYGAQTESTVTQPGSLTSNGTTSASFWSGASWPTANIGQQLQPRQPDDELKAALAEVDPDRIKATILKLVSFGTRHTLSSQTDPNRGIGAARNWIADEMRRYANASGGRMEVTVPAYTQQATDRVRFPVLISNVVATLRGSSDPARVYVVTGHYDSRVTDVNNSADDAPGANDDASGVAGMF